MHWFTIGWYAYLFRGCTGLTNLICRATGHSCGVVWFNASGLEPDLHCRRCGEDLS